MCGEGSKSRLASLVAAVSSAGDSVIVCPSRVDSAKGRTKKRCKVRGDVLEARTGARRARIASLSSRSSHTGRRRRRSGLEQTPQHLQNLLAALHNGQSTFEGVARGKLIFDDYARNPGGHGSCHAALRIFDGDTF